MVRKNCKQRPLKIFIDLSKLRHPYTGLATVSLAYADALAEWVHQNKSPLATYQIYCMVPARYKNRWKGKLRTLPYCRWYKLYFYWYRFAWVHYPHQDFSLIGIPSWQRLMVCVHDLNFLYEKTPQRAKTYLHSLGRKLRRASIITCISHFTKKEIITHFKRDQEILAKPISVIYNGVTPLSVEQGRKPHFPLPSPYLLAIGVLYPKKQFECLIAMLRFLPEYHLLIVGEGRATYKRFLVRTIEQNGMTDRIHLLGEVEEEEKVFLLANTIAYVSASKAEGFGLPIIEAMHLGKEVFLSDLSAHSEIGGQYAVYWKDLTPERMAQVIREHIGKNTYTAKERRNYAQRFSWEEAVRAYEQLYLQ